MWNLKYDTNKPNYGGSDGKESACNAGDLDSVPGLGRSPGGGHGSPPQYSCLENPGGLSPWVHKESEATWVAKSQTQLSN